MTNKQTDVSELVEQSPLWLGVNEHPYLSNALYGFNKDWINADGCPQGIREIAYCGDKYASSKWCPVHDEWVHKEDENPTHVCMEFPFEAALQSQSEQITRLEKEVERLRVALKPFADAFDGSCWDDEKSEADMNRWGNEVIFGNLDMEITKVEFYRARQSLKETHNENTDTQGGE